MVTFQKTRNFRFQMILNTLKDRSTSEKAFQKALKITPGGVHSPVRACKGLLSTPLIVKRGYRDHIEDVDGNSYIDFCGSWGALIHGHAHPKIVAAATAQVAFGSSFGITTESEAKLASAIVATVDPIEKVRFVSSGTEATMSALRLARGFTKRNLIIKFAGHYHGHADFLLAQAGSGVASLNATSTSLGIPQDAIKHTLVLPFNDFDACKRCFALPEVQKELAAIILEPIAANMGLVPPLPGFLAMLREESAKMGALLIIDEVITGFRVGLKGACALYNIKPDLVCLGKIIGGGFPAAAFGGREEIMDLLAPLGGVYQAGTLSANPVAMEAGFTALTMLQEPCFYDNLEKKRKVLTDPIVEMIEKKGLNICLEAVGSMFTLFFGRDKILNFEDVKSCDQKMFAHFFQFLFERGIYIAPSAFEAHFVSAAHEMENLCYARDCMLEFLDSMPSL